MKKNQRKHGWVLEVKYVCGKTRYVEDLYPVHEPACWTYSLGKAYVFATRQLARYQKQDFESICKVQLNRNGKPMRVLSRGQ